MYSEFKEREDSDAGGDAMADSRFSFRNMEPDSRLATRANLRLLETLTLGPRDAQANGTIERMRDYYVATLEVRSKFIHRIERAAGLSPQSAIERVLRKLENFLYKWRYADTNEQTPAGSRENQSAPILAAQASGR